MRRRTATDSDVIQLLKDLVFANSPGQSVLWFNKSASHVWMVSSAEACRGLSAQQELFEGQGKSSRMRLDIDISSDTSKRLAAFRLMHNALCSAFPSPNLARYGINHPMSFGDSGICMTPRDLLIADPSIKTMSRLRFYFTSFE